MVATILFQVSLTKSHYSKRRLEKTQSMDKLESSKESDDLSLLGVLKKVELYKATLLYTFSRLFLVICIIYIPIWLNEFMKTEGGLSIENIALIPLIFFVASFFAALPLKYINQKCSQKVRISKSAASNLIETFPFSGHLQWRLFDFNFRMCLGSIFHFSQSL
jgi:fucose permease